jgi:hypothetical protein
MNDISNGLLTFALLKELNNKLIATVGAIEPILKYMEKKNAEALPMKWLLEDEKTIDAITKWKFRIPQAHEEHVKYGMEKMTERMNHSKRIASIQKNKAAKKPPKKGKSK